MTSRDDSAETFWDLLADIARLQAEIGKDLVAWAQASEAAARAYQRNSETLELMADIGRRAEHSMRRGPSAAARLAMQFFSNPLQATGTTPGGPTGDPFARFWENWRAAAEPRNPSSPGDKD